MNDTRTRFVILLLGAPEILEGAERSKNRSTNPYRVLSLRRRDDLNLKKVREKKKSASRAMNRKKWDISSTHFYACWWQRRQFLLHTISDTREHGGPSRQYDVSVQITTDIEITLEDRVVAMMDGPSINFFFTVKNWTVSLRGLVDTLSFKSKHAGLEKGLRCSESEQQWRYKHVTKIWVNSQHTARCK